VSAISIEVVCATSEREKELCYRVRYDVFVRETGYIQKEIGSGLEADDYDRLDTTVHFLVYFNGQPAGTARLLFPNRSVREREGGFYGLPMENLYDIKNYMSTDLKIGEISRSCVKERFKSTKTIFYLWKSLLEYAGERGITDLITNVNPETDSLADSYLVHRYARSMRLFDPDITVYPKKTGGKTSDFRFPLERKSAGGSGEEFDIEFPQTLKLFTRVGALFTGEPIYCNGIDMCALPMNWKLKDICKSAFGKFFQKKDAAEKAA